MRNSTGAAFPESGALLTGCGEPIFGHWEATSYFGINTEEDEVRLILFEDLQGILVLGNDVGIFSSVEVEERDDGEEGYLLDITTAEWICPPIIHEDDGVDQLSCTGNDALEQEYNFIRQLSD